jgi:hypothetical protein
VREARHQLPQGLGQLFSDGGTGRVLDVDLPPGRLVVPHEETAAARPAYWLSDEPGGGDLWARLRQAHARSGLWPVSVSPHDGNPKVPWVVGEVSPLTTEHAEHVAAEQFAFCPDNIVQGHAPTIREYAARMVQGKTIWSFWWD